MYIYCSEIIGGNLRLSTTALCFVSFGLGEVCLNIFMIFIHDFKTLILFQGYCLTLISIGYIFFIESPFFLYKKGSMGSMLKCLTYISKVNNKNEIHNTNVRNLEKKLMIPDPVDNLQLVLNLEKNKSSKKDLNLSLNDTKEESLLQSDLESDEEFNLKESQTIRERILNIKINNIDLNLTSKNMSTDIENLQETELQPVESYIEANGKGNFMDIFIKENFLNLIGSSLLVSMIGIGYGVTIQINQKLGIKNPYLNGALMGVFETGGYFLGFLLCTRLSRRKINIIANLGLFICSLIIIVMDLIYNSTNSDPLNKPTIFNVFQLGLFYPFN